MAILPSPPAGGDPVLGNDWVTILVLTSSRWCRGGRPVQSLSTADGVASRIRSKVDWQLLVLQPLCRQEAQTQELSLRIEQTLLARQPSAGSNTLDTTSELPKQARSADQVVPLSTQRNRQHTWP